jgi:hypothetical protein
MIQIVLRNHLQESGFSQETIQFRNNPTEEFNQDLFSGPELGFFHFCEIEIQKDAIDFNVLRLETDQTFSMVDSVTIPRWECLQESAKQFFRALLKNRLTKV